MVGGTPYPESSFFWLRHHWLQNKVNYRVPGSLVHKKVLGLKARQTLPAAVASYVAQQLGRTTYQSIHLNSKYTGTPDLPASQDYPASVVTQSTLANGVRVVSRSSTDPMCNIGLYVQAGSRYCTPELSGMGHFLEMTAPYGTKQILPLRWSENMARTGTTYAVQSFRDAITYQCETLKKNADFALESIVEQIWNSGIEEYHLGKEIHGEYMWARGDVMKSADHEIPEWMHQAAYQNNTIGLPMFCDHNSIKNVTMENIAEFKKIFYQPKRIIVTGTGIDHADLEKLATESIGDLVGEKKYEDLEFEQARYTGGQMSFRYDFDAEEPATHVALLFETESWKSPDLMALCVLNMLMGGGGSFSAGGPGKGMYTRLYRDVLGTHHWVHHVSCSHSIFDDTGLFCLYGFAAPEYAGDLTGVMVREAVDMVQRPPSTEELDRAKRCLISNIAFEYENRQVVWEDLARQISVYGHYRSPSDWRVEIEKVTADDVVRVASKLLSSKPTLLSCGPDVSRVPLVDEVAEAIKRGC
jgi:processing peptidase subunit alpha